MGLGTITGRDVALRPVMGAWLVTWTPNQCARMAPLLSQTMPNVRAAELITIHRLSRKLAHRFPQRGRAVDDDHRALHVALYEPAGSKWSMRLIGIIGVTLTGIAFRVPAPRRRAPRLWHPWMPQGAGETERAHMASGPILRARLSSSASCSI